MTPERAATEVTMGQALGLAVTALASVVAHGLGDDGEAARQLLGQAFDAADAVEVAAQREADTFELGRARRLRGCCEHLGRWLDAICAPRN